MPTAGSVYSLTLVKVRATVFPGKGCGSGRGLIDAALSVGTFVSRVALAVVLLFAGASKIAQPRDLRVQIVRDYGILPTKLADWAGITLPYGEVGLGAALIVGFWMPFPAIVAGLVFLAFAFGMAINLARGRRIDCGCFGTPQHPISWSRVATNVMFAAIALAGGVGSEWTRPIAMTGEGVGLTSDQLWISALLLAFATALVLVGFSVHRLRHLPDLGVEMAPPVSVFGRVLVLASEWASPREVR